MDTVNQPTAAPTRKMQYTAVVGVLAWGITTALGRYFGADIPADLGAAIPILAGTLAGYVVRERAD
jgi:uncharacterized membrane protein YjjB (DUF3815 family)